MMGAYLESGIFCPIFLHQIKIKDFKQNLRQWEEKNQQNGMELAEEISRKGNSSIYEKDKEYQYLIQMYWFLREDGALTFPHSIFFW